jgi:peroxiredoxin
MTINKKILLCILFFIIGQNYYAKAQQQEGYTIDAYIEGLQEGEKVTMMLADNNKGQGAVLANLVPRDSTYARNGKFQISGIVPEGPRRYLMVFDKHNGNTKNGGSTLIRRVILFINNGERITIKSPDINKIQHGYIGNWIAIEGSPTNDAMRGMDYVAKMYFSSLHAVDNFIKKNQDSIGFKRDLVETSIYLRNKINHDYYFYLFRNGSEREPLLQIADLFLPTVYDHFGHSGHDPFWIDYYNKLDEKRKNSFLGKWLKDLLPLCVGQKFPEFTLPDLEGKEISSTNFITKGKITLVHFWMSPSKSNQEYDDELRILYKKYKDKGLNILGVSRDNTREQWKEFVEAQQYPWANVIDKKGKITREKYFEYDTGGANLVNVLVDNEGKILAWNVKGPVLQWYLLKYLENT